MLRLHVFAADLQIVAVGIFDVKTIVCIGTRLESSTDQFRFDFFLVPVVDGIRDVADVGRFSIRSREVGSQTR